MCSIVGLNDGADEQNKWVRVLKDVEEVCVRQGGRRRSDAADVLRNRINNEMPAPDASVPGELLGREGAQERRTLQKIRRIQKIARGTAENERNVESAMFQVKPSKLVVPTRDEPLSMFDPATWGMSFPDLFPWGDGLPFLKREANMDATEVFRYLLLREELHYSEGDALLPRWSLSVLWIWFIQLLLSFLFSQDGLVVVFWWFQFLSLVAFVPSMRAGDVASSDVRRAASITVDACDESACDASWLWQTLSCYF